MTLGYAGCTPAICATPNGRRTRHKAPIDNPCDITSVEIGRPGPLVGGTRPDNNDSCQDQRPSYHMERLIDTARRDPHPEGQKPEEGGASQSLTRRYDTGTVSLSHLVGFGSLGTPCATCAGWAWQAYGVRGPVGRPSGTGAGHRSAL